MKSVFYLLLVVRDGLSNKTKQTAYFCEHSITRHSSNNYNNNTASRDYLQYYTLLFVDECCVCHVKMQIRGRTNSMSTSIHNLKPQSRLCILIQLVSTFPSLLKPGKLSFNANSSKTNIQFLFKFNLIILFWAESVVCLSFDVVHFVLIRKCRT